MDSPLKGLEQYEGAPADEIRRAPRAGLSNLVDLAIDQQVQFVLIAGDLYDGNWKDFQTGMVFVKQAVRLREARIPLYLIAGNHDAANKMTRSLPLPENVTLFPANAATTAMVADLDVAIHGQSFATAEITEDLSLAYPAAVAGCVNIGLLHTSVDGREGHVSYAPCKLDGLRLKGYDYWGLGHIHKREVLCAEPLVVFPGNIQGRHIRETGPKGCYVVTVHDDRRLEPKFYPLDIMRWEVARVDISSAVDDDQVLASVSQRLCEARNASPEHSLAVRVELQGASALHGQLLAHQETWIHQIRSLALDAGQGQMWIEKVKFFTSDPASASRRHVDEAALGELTDLFAQARQDSQILKQVGFDFSPVLKKLPPELRAEIGSTEQLDPAWLATAVQQAEALLIHRLTHPVGKP